MYHVLFGVSALPYLLFVWVYTACSVDVSCVSQSSLLSCIQCCCACFACACYFKMFVDVPFGCYRICYSLFCFCCACTFGQSLWCVQTLTIHARSCAHLIADHQLEKVCPGNASLQWFSVFFVISPCTGFCTKHRAAWLMTDNMCCCNSVNIWRSRDSAIRVLLLVLTCHMWCRCDFCCGLRSLRETCVVVGSFLHWLWVYSSSNICSFPAVHNVILCVVSFMNFVLAMSIEFTLF